MIYEVFSAKNMLNMPRNKEIGSEFWLDADLKGERIYTREALVLSGRTAIDAIIKDILRARKVRNVYMPAYCCESMIDPFFRNGIEVNLYDLEYNEGLHYIVDEEYPADIFYVNNYFGYENTISKDIIENFKRNGAIVIYDKTHSLFMTNDATDELADYTFASIRKWMGVVDGAVVNKRDGEFDLKLKDYPYLRSKIDAMREKAKYIIQGDPTISKSGFLEKFSEFGRHLKEDYQEYKMDDLSVRIWLQSDKVSIREQRRENAAILHMENELHFFGKLSTGSCPIFVPVLFESTEIRNAVRMNLMENKIYCPIHWPKNELVTSDMKVNKIFDTVLSLICDQRYTQSDMERTIEVVDKSLT